MPKPKVDAGIVRIVPRKIPLIKNHDFETVEKVTKGIFRYKNKQWQSAFK